MVRGKESAPRVSPEDEARWRSYEETLRALERFARLDPTGFRGFVVRHTLYLLGEQRKLRAYLRSRFGVEYVIEHATEAGGAFHIRRVITDPRRLPHTRAANSMYENTCLDIATIEAFFQELLDAAAAVDRGEVDLDGAFARAFLWWYRTLPAFYGVRAQMARDPGAREHGLWELSAWLAPEVALRVPRRADLATRTKRALDDEGVALDEALPPAVLAVLPEWLRADEPLRRPGGRRTSLVSRVESHIAGQGSGPEQRRQELEQLAAFADREAILARARAAGLPPREYELLRVFIDNPGATNAEAGRRLGIAVGTVKSLKHRIKNTLGAA
jgi:DNA-binding CsgD family transcriptional regulator